RVWWPGRGVRRVRLPDPARLPARHGPRRWHRHHRLPGAVGRDATSPIGPTAARAAALARAQSTDSATLIAVTGRPLAGGAIASGMQTAAAASRASSCSPTTSACRHVAVTTLVAAARLAVVAET